MRPKFTNEALRTHYRTMPNQNVLPLTLLHVTSVGLTHADHLLKPQHFMRQRNLKRQIPTKASNDPFIDFLVCTEFLFHSHQCQKHSPKRPVNRKGNSVSHQESSSQQYAIFLLLWSLTECDANYSSVPVHLFVSFLFPWFSIFHPIL